MMVRASNAQGRTGLVTENAQSPGGWTEIIDEKSLEAFLKGKPREWGEVLGVRAALRVQPTLNELFANPNLGTSPSWIILSLWRRLSSFLLIFFAPERVKEIRLSFDVADLYTHTAAHRAIYAAHAARLGSRDVQLSAHSASFAAKAAVKNKVVDAVSAVDFVISRVSDVVPFVSAPVTAGSAFYPRVNLDAKSLSDGKRIAELAGQPLGEIHIDWAKVFPDGTDVAKHPPTDLFAPQWESLKRNLLALDEDWQVWLHWYEAIRDGRAPWGISRKAGLDLLLEALQWPEADWEKGPKHINPKLTALVEKARREEQQRTASEQEAAADGPVTVEYIANAASPLPFINSDGKLDVGPNPNFDRPEISPDLYELPAQQISLLDSLIPSLPRNAPPIVVASLTEYKIHLEKRSFQPHLGTLKQHAAIVRADWNSRDADDWRSAGLSVSFQLFEANDALFMKHFPLDPKREAQYAQVEIDEEKLAAPELARLSADLAAAAEQASEANVATDDFVADARTKSAFAGALADNPGAGQLNFGVTEKDRVAVAAVSVRKRFALNMLGFVTALQSAAALVTVLKDGSEAWKHLVLIAGQIKDFLVNALKGP